MKINKRRIYLIIFDILCFALVAAACFFFPSATFEKTAFESGAQYALSASALCAVLFLSRLVFRVYTTLWRYTSTQAYFRTILADIIGCACTVLVTEIFFYDYKFWIFITISALYTLLSLFTRLGYRLLYKRSNETFVRRERINIAIVGAGQLGAFLAGELSGDSQSRYRPVCFIDVDKTKIGSRIAGLKVFSSEEFEKKKSGLGVSAVVFALANVEGERKTELCDYYKSIGCRVLIYDSPIHALRRNGRRVIREFEIEDLLFRNQPRTPTGIS